MKGETLDCFDFLCDGVAALVDAAPVLRQLLLRNLVVSLKISPCSASNFQYCKSCLVYCVERKSSDIIVVRGK